ncbi:hypothetical protein GF324_12030 [bacterium]|nr:hypothetical protein [bacterium]
MWRKNGTLLSLLLIGLFVFTGTAVSANNTSVFTFEKHPIDFKYGIQVHGGAGLYAMGDVNDYRAQGAPAENEEDAEMGIAWGLSLLYRASEHVRWEIGFTSMGEDRTYTTWQAGAVTSEVEQTVSGSEFYVVPNWLFNPDGFLLVSLGLGPSIVSGTLDRSVTQGTSFYNATGRSIGGRAQLGLQLRVNESWALNLQGGYRLAKVGRLINEDRDGNETTVYWGFNDRQMSTDFSGPFVELGLRLYFKPATKWHKI